MVVARIATLPYRFVWVQSFNKIERKDAVMFWKVAILSVALGSVAVYGCDDSSPENEWTPCYYQCVSENDSGEVAKSDNCSALVAKSEEECRDLAEEECGNNLEHYAYVEGCHGCEEECNPVWW